MRQKGQKVSNMFSMTVDAAGRPGRPGHVAYRRTAVQPDRGADPHRRARPHRAARRAPARDAGDRRGGRGVAGHPVPVLPEQGPRAGRGRRLRRAPLQRRARRGAGRGPAPEDRIGAFMAYAFDFIRSHPCRPLFESESGFVMSYLLDHLPSLRARARAAPRATRSTPCPRWRPAPSTASSWPTSSSASSRRAGSSPSRTTPRSCSPSTASLQIRSE